jgi:hypothetical protein
VLSVAFAVILSASLPLSPQATGRTPYQTKPLGGIKWSQEKPVDPGIDTTELESLYLNMRSGLDANDEDPSTPGDEDNLDKSSDWIHTIYRVPMKEAPGSKYSYCSINAFLTGAIVENVSHMPLDEFARVNLFEPLGIQDYRWRHVPINRITGQGNLSITTRDLAVIGELMLNDGVVNGRRLLSHDWIARSLASQVAFVEDSRRCLPSNEPRSIVGG